jgi:putative FmdB family regulatory protein
MDIFTFPEALMPIYEYRCSSCGHQQEFLQKLSDAPHTRCTKCGEESFAKMVTAAGFQLKGSGWYATDFKGGAKPAAKPEGGEAKAAGEAKSDGAAGPAPACGTGACPACQ